MFLMMCQKNSKIFTHNKKQNKQNKGDGKYINLTEQKIKQVQKEKIKSLVALKASILDKAFKGEL